MAQTVPETEFVSPKDWPALSGDIDLIVQDMPHDSAETEWWYVNSHVTTAEGLPLSVFASFFRTCSIDDKNEKEYSHSVTWAVSDPRAQKYHSFGMLDPKTPSIIAKGIKDGTLRFDKNISKAFLEIVEKDILPLPDKRISGEIRVEAKKNGQLDLIYGDSTFFRLEDGSYRLKCDEGDISIDMIFKPEKKVFRQGTNGVVRVGRNRENMFYYFIPRCKVTGTVGMNGKSSKIQGSGWYDHEFGGMIKGPKKPVHPEEEDKPDYAWSWVSVQLEDGRELTVTVLCEPKTGLVRENYAILMDEDKHYYEDVELVALEKWRSCQSFIEYPTKWKLTIPSIEMDITLQSEYDEQEFMTLISRPGFWEGRMQVTGSINRIPVKGLGFVEVYGYQDISSFNGYLQRVGAKTKETIDKILPHHPSDADMLRLVASDPLAHYLDGIDRTVFEQTLIEPIRMIIDRGGKSWRSYALLLCIDCVGGDSRKWVDWLAMPELMHTGSLIVDDVQDESIVRRGGTACHLVYGEPIAINAGTAAYFISQTISYQDLSAEDKVRIYEIYFQALRSGHTGQALDIKGLDYLMKDAVESGDSAQLEKVSKTIHLLKSAAPASALARIGVIVGNGSEEQIDCLGRFFEALGVAFQIVDDVLNLRGFEKKLKDRGEDLSAGKVTYPVAKAMSMLKSKTEREQLWNVIQSKPKDQQVIDDAIDVIEKCGALQAAAEEAQSMVDEAWSKVDVLIEPSYYKLMLRAFSWFLLDRMY